MSVPIITGELKDDIEIALNASHRHGFFLGVGWGIAFSMVIWCILNVPFR